MQCLKRRYKCQPTCKLVLPNALAVFCMANLLNGLFTVMLLPVMLELAIESKSLNLSDRAL